MQHRSVLRTLAILASAALTSVACASQQTSSTANANDSTLDDGSDVDPVIETPIAELKSVYFDFDSSEIRADAASQLRENGSMVRGAGGMGVVTLQGHCDERGSEEYNLALGERRAQAVKRYLADLGVPDSRLETVSFGEMRPAVAGRDESAWRWNRRVEFVSER
jgi:peptidoglycan-associated lipoprotein